MEAASLFVTVRAITAQFEEAMTRVNGRLAGAAATMSRTGKAFTDAGAKMTRHLTLPILGVAAASAKMSLDFHQQMQLIQTQAGGSARDVKELSKQVLGLAKSTTQGPVELAKGLYHFKSLLYDNADAMKLLKVSSHAATMGLAPLEETTTGLGAVLRTFHLNAKQGASTMGALNAIVGAGNMRFEDLVSALGTGVMPSAKIAGLSLKDVGAAMAVMTDEGLHSNQAMTRFKTSLSMLAAPSSQASKWLDKIHLSGAQLGMDMRQGIVPTVADLKAHLSTLNGSGVIAKLSDSFHRGKLTLAQFQSQAKQTEQFQVLSKILGGGRTATTFELLLNNFDLLKNKMNQINRTTGNFGANVKAAMENPANQAKVAMSNIQVAMIAFGDNVVPLLIPLLDDVAKLTGLFTKLSSPMQHLVVVAALLVAGIGPLLTVVGNVIKMAGYLTKAIKGIGVALEFAAANPIILIIAALVAVGVGLYELYEHCATFRNLVNEVFSAVASATSAAMRVLREVVSAAVTYVEGLWQRWGGQFMATAHSIQETATVAWHAIEAVTRAVWPVIEALIRTAVDAVRVYISVGFKTVEKIAKDVWPVITTVVRAAWNVIKAVVSTDIKVVLDIVNTVMALLRGDWGKAWASLKKLVSDYLHGIASVVKAVLFGAIAVAKAAAIGIGRAILDGIVTGVGGLAGALARKVKSEIGGAWGAIKGHLGIHSPSSKARDEIGKPIAQGIIIGATKLDELPVAITRRLRAALDAAKNTVTSYRGELSTAFRKLVSDADQAFNAQTQTMMNNLRDQLNSQLGQIDSQLRSKLASIQAAGAALTPEEQAANGLQATIKQQQDAKALADAQSQLADAQKSGDAGQIADAQYNLQQVQEQQQLESLQAAAQLERKGRNAQTKEREAAAKAEAAKAKQRAREKYEHHRANLEALRKLEKKSLDERLANLEKALAKDPLVFAKAHKAVMKLLNKTIGPDLFKSGTKLGNEFAAGIRSAMGEVERASAQMAAVVAKYLRLHSPAKAGPLSTLDHWWDAFTPTLLKGLNGDMLRGAVTAAALPMPAIAGAGGVIARGGGRSGTPVFRAELHSHTYLDGREIAHGVRDVIVREGKYNGGGMFGGQA
jgi:TP901 family phage tail tape measure protein